ncbi:MAG: ABC transporter substrate-binding protein [Treponema sp.]|nr:ABC transporter substrate-binding protein [Treponema sp.]
MKRTVFALLALSCAALVFFGGCRGDGDAVPIGAIFPLSGPVAFYGTESRDGALLALEEINAAGGLLGSRLRMLSEDDEGNSELTMNAFTMLTSRHNVGIVLGSSTSGPTLAVSTLAQQLGVVLISPSATNINVTNAGDYVFRACFIDPFQGVVGAEFAYNSLGSRRAAILFDAGADYNSGLADAFRTYFRGLGGSIVADEAYQTGAVDFNAQITRIRNANPDVIYLPNYVHDVALQIRQIRAQGINVPLVGGDGWDGLIDQIGDEALNGFWSAGFAADTTEPRGAAFVRAFEARFNRPASQFAALGYDTMMIVVEGIRAAGSFDPALVKDAMARTDGQFITGNIRFDADRNPIKGAAILEIVRRDGSMANAYRTTVNPR